ncbi:MAG: SUF system NifU family Fe-S cluster assembly protein [Acidobacteriota bacterium]|nr:MAG: SUF system NifU family Fe-S cluster assembly protein [Acidobacteriota bacterium]
MDTRFPELSELYRDIVLDHYRSPRGNKELHDCDVRNEGFNPLCGDSASLALKLQNGNVADVAVQCRGCSISVASGSMLAELLKDRSVEEVEKLMAAFKGMMHGEAIPEGLDIGDLDALEGVRKFPVRVKCALLAWITLADALKAWKAGGSRPEAASTTEEE